jgi:hypothetical protein
MIKFLLDLDVFVFAIVMASWQFLTGSPLSLRTVATVAGLWIISRFFGAVREIEKHDSSTPTVKQKKEFVDDPAAVLEIARLSGCEAIRRFTPFLGKWMTISGAFEGLAESLQRDAIHLSLLLSDARRVNLRFSIEQAEALRALREGQTITAICQIEHRGFVFTPENCELLRVEPLRKDELSRLAYAS